eukprot:SAG11_NODE_25834_length_353_cov_0.980315_1_plen_33_part_10
MRRGTITLQGLIRYYRSQDPALECLTTQMDKIL